MKLILDYFDIQNIAFSDTTCLERKTLFICRKDIEDLIMRDSQISRVSVDIANPGDSCRILPVKDALQPRTKLDGRSGYFGSQGVEPDRMGTSKTLVLDGVSVLLLGPIVSNMEGIVDMTGEGAEYTPFGKTANLTLWVETKRELNPEQVKKAQHDALAKVAVFLAEKASGLEPDRQETLVWEPMAGDLPRIGIVDLFVLRTSYDTLVYGEDSGGFIPTMINPLAALDGAIENVSGRVSGHRPATFYHQNNPVILEGLNRHGKTINLVGVLVSLHENVFEKKIKNAQLVCDLARMLQLDGLIVIEENKGNPDADIMLICRNAENSGIKTVLMTDESAGEDGCSVGMADSTPLANAMITSGNCNATIELPVVDKVIGDINCVGKINGTFFNSLHEDGSITAELLAIPGSCIEMGYTDLMCESI